MNNIFQMTLNEVNEQLSGEESLLWAVLNSAIEDKDLKFINGKMGRYTCDNLRIDYTYIKEKICK